MGTPNITVPLDKWEGRSGRAVALRLPFEGNPPMLEVPGHDTIPSAASDARLLRIPPPCVAGHSDRSAGLRPWHVAVVSVRSEHSGLEFKAWKFMEVHVASC